MENEEKKQFFEEIRKTLCLAPYLPSEESQEAVAECFDAYLFSELDSEQERALNRFAWRFKHLLKPRMQRILEARYSPDGSEKTGCKEKRRLILDDLYASEDPEVERSLSELLQDARGIARERPLVRLAWRFKHLLSARMQETLEAQYPAESI